MIGLRSQASRTVSLDHIQQGADQNGLRATALNFTQALQVGSSPLGVIRLHPDDMRAPCRAGPGSYRWSDCESASPGNSRFLS